jgi:hypothetical protein
VNSVFEDVERVKTFIGLLVERLGGQVVFSEAEVNASMTAAGATIYMEVDSVDNSFTLEVIPKDRDAKSNPTRAPRPRLRDGSDSDPA